MNVADAVSREAQDQLQTFWEMLQRWNARINLIAASTATEGWRRHVEDSIQLAGLLPPHAVRHCDLGSGGGCPAIPLAVVRRALGFHDQLIMIEADARKAVFLRSACRAVDLPAVVEPMRIERADPAGADVVTARALAPLPRLLSMTVRHLCRGGIAVLPKGRRAAEELAMARETWFFEAETFPSRTDPEATILRIREIDQKL